MDYSPGRMVLYLFSAFSCCFVVKKNWNHEITQNNTNKPPRKTVDRNVQYMAQCAARDILPGGSLALF